MCNTSNLKYFPCVVWILTTAIPALSSDSQNNLMYGFPPNSRPGRDSTLSDEHRIFAAAAFTEHFLTFLCLVPTETLLNHNLPDRPQRMIPWNPRLAAHIAEQRVGPRIKTAHRTFPHISSRSTHSILYLGQ